MNLTYLRDIPSPAPRTYSATTFISLVPFASGYIAAYRDFTPEKSNTESEIRGQRYDADFNLAAYSWPLMLGCGEDPRSFLLNGRPMCLVSKWKGSENADSDQIIVDPLNDGTRPLTHDLAFAGKNWMPVENSPLIVRSIQPLVILATLPCGECKTVIGSDEEIGEYRGGAAARIVDGAIVGFGHRTLGPDSHEPYYFEIRGKEVRIVDLARPRLGGDALCDPTSWFGDKLICACADKSWWTPQPIVHRLYRIEGI